LLQATRPISLIDRRQTEKNSAIKQTNSAKGNSNNGLFHLAATAGLDAHNTYILHIEPKYKKNNKSATKNLTAIKTHIKMIISA